MKYLALAMKIEIMFIGLTMMYMFPVVSNPPFMSGVAFFSIGLYLILQGCMGDAFSGSVFCKKKPEPPKKK
jgi:hypothetical protein